jgi:hypothetical protein
MNHGQVRETGSSSLDDSEGNEVFSAEENRVFAIVEDLLNHLPHCGEGLPLISEWDFQIPKVAYPQIGEVSIESGALRLYSPGGFADGIRSKPGPGTIGGCSIVGETDDTDFATVVRTIG